MISCSMYMHMLECINILQAFAQIFHVLFLMNDFAVVERWLCLYIMYKMHVFWLFTFINLFIFRTFQKTIIKMQLVLSFAVFYYYSRYAHWTVKFVKKIMANELMLDVRVFTVTKDSSSYSLYIIIPLSIVDA